MGSARLHFSPVKLVPVYWLETFLQSPMTRWRCNLHGESTPSGALRRAPPHNLKRHCSLVHFRMRPHHSKYFFELKDNPPLKNDCFGHTSLALKRKFISYHFLYKLELYIKELFCKTQASLCPTGSVSMENALLGFKTNIVFTTRITRIKISKPFCRTMIPSLWMLPQTRDCIATESGSALHHVS